MAKQMSSVVITLLKFILPFYYLFSICFRLAFRYNATYTSNNWFCLLLDYLADIFFILDYIVLLRKRTSFAIAPAPSHVDVDGEEMQRAARSSSYIAPDDNSKNQQPVINDRKKQVEAFERLLAQFEIQQRADAARKARMKRDTLYDIISRWTNYFLELLMIFPFEVVAYLCGYRFYYMLRTFRVIRMWNIREYWRGVVRFLESNNLITGASGHRVVALTVFMLVLAHLGACIFYTMGLAIMEKDDPVADNWMTADGMAVFDKVTNNYYFTRSLRYRYVRTLYWAVVTSQTVGFGDIGPQSVYETCFCLCYFYLSHFIAQLAIGNLILLVNVYDSARTKYRNQMDRLEIYAQFRGLPVEITDRIRSFYYHQWKVLNGLDEAQFLTELPHNIEMKIKQTTVRDFLKEVSILKGLRVYILNALAEDVKTMMYAPHDVIVAAGSQGKGMYIVSRGEAYVHTMSTHKEDDDDDIDETDENIPAASDKHDEIIISQALRQGESYGSKALTQKFIFASTLSCGAGVCEVLFLSRSRFRRTLRFHMSDDEFQRAFPPGNPLLGAEQSGEYDCSFVNGSLSTSPLKVPYDRRRQRNLSRVPERKKNHSHIRAGFIQVETKSTWIQQMKPESSFRNTWDICIFFGLFFHSITIPYLLSVCLDPQFFQQELPLLVCCFIVDTVFFANLVFRAFFFSYYRVSVLFTKPPDIFSNFCHHNNYFLEILAVLPLELLAVKLGPSFVPVLRVMKIYLFLSFMEYGNRLERIMTANLGITLSFVTRRFLKLYMALFELCHWVGCLWQLVADCSTQLLGYDVNWKIQDRDADFLHMNYPNLYGSSAYRRSIYWAINGMATTGVADMPSSNLLEMMFCCLTLVLGCQSINALLGSIASLMGNINMEKRNFQAKMGQVKKLVRFRKIPYEIERRIVYFFEYRWSKTSGANEVEVLAGLPQPLREEVVKYVAGSVLVKIPFFTDCIEPMLEMILGLLSHRLFLEGDTLMTAGEHGREMFVIESGTILVTSPGREIVYATLGSGAYIGESCLLKVAKRSASAHARDYSDTYVLSKEDFQRVLEAFPGEGEVVVEGIEKVLEAKKRMNEETNKKKALTPTSTTAQNEEKSGDGEGSSASSPNDREQNTRVKPDEVVRKDGVTKYDWHLELEAGSRSRRMWDSFLFIILLYNLVMVPFRIALSIYPPLYALDYIFDLLLILDSYLNWTWFRRNTGGKHIKDPSQIRAAYFQDSLKQDIIARFPWDVFVLCFIGTHKWRILKVMSWLRVPKLLLAIKGMSQMVALESLLEETNLTFVSLRLFQVLCACLLVGHWLACGLYLFSLAYPRDCTPNPDDVEYYGTACRFRDTWVQFQIMNDKLPRNGGTQISRYLRAMNWAIPTMVLYVVGDVYPMNVNETSYVFGAMFFGIAINALIVGNIIALMSTLDEGLTNITTKSDSLREHLQVHNVDSSLIRRVSAYMKFLLTETGQVLLKEEDIYTELPHTLQVAVHTHIKLNFFKNCPFFDFCTDEVLRNLCMVMKPQVFYTGDTIISYGDLGQEMFFIERGSAEVISADGKTVFTKLQAGGFFGETGLVFRSRRTANIRAAELCVCYAISKDELDGELRDCEFNVEATIKALCNLQEGNARRNQAVTQNLKAAARVGTKLHRVLGTINTVEKKSWFEVLSHPNGWLKTAVDIFGFVAVLFYGFTIPFLAVFMFGRHAEVYRRVFMPVSLTLDGLVFLELMMRIFFFPFGEHASKIENEMVEELYSSGGAMLWDIIGSIPLELLVLLPSVGFDTFFALRLIKMVKLGNVLQRLSQVEKHAQRNGMTVHRITLVCVESWVAYLWINHWMACCFFAVHRYLERGYDLTWVIQDGYATFNPETGQHDICSVEIWECYQRSMYFVGTVLTSVGYGDINPYTDYEMIMAVIQAIIGACMGANVCGQMSAYLQIGDKSGSMAFKEKMRAVEHYCHYRGLRSELRSSIMTNFRTMWRAERRLGDASSSFLSSLTKPLAEQVASELNRDAMINIPMLKTCRKSLQGRIALAMKPQVLLPSYPVYSVGDSGHCVFFVQSGKVIIKLATEKEISDDVTLATLRILNRKQEFTGGLHTLGTHFGEFCVMTKLGIRSESATPTEITEVFYYDKDDIWNLFVGMPFSERYRFLLAMFSEVGGIAHSKGVEQSPQPSDGIVGTSIRNLYKLAALVVDDILATYGKRGDDEMSDNGEQGSVSTAVLKQTNVRRISIISNDASDDESRDEPAGMSKWSEALKAYDRTRSRRKSSRMGLSIKSGTGFSPAVGSSKDNDDVDSLEDEMENTFGTLEKRIRALFAYIDKDGSGSIDKNELMLSLLDLGIERSWADVDSMISFADKDGDAEVDLEELVAAIMRELKREAVKQEEAESLDNSEDILSQEGGDIVMYPVHTILEEATCDDEAIAAASAYAMAAAAETSEGTESPNTTEVAIGNAMEGTAAETLQPNDMVVSETNGADDGEPSVGEEEVEVTAGADRAFQSTAPQGEETPPALDRAPNPASEPPVMPATDIVSNGEDPVCGTDLKVHQGAHDQCADYLFEDSRTSPRIEHLTATLNRTPSEDPHTPEEGDASLGTETGTQEIPGSVPASEVPDGLINDDVKESPRIKGPFLSPSPTECAQETVATGGELSVANPVNAGPEVVFASSEAPLVQRKQSIGSWLAEPMDKEDETLDSTKDKRSSWKTRAGSLGSRRSDHEVRRRDSDTSHLSDRSHRSVQAASSDASQGGEDRPIEALLPPADEPDRDVTFEDKNDVGVDIAFFD